MQLGEQFLLEEYGLRRKTTVNIAVQIVWPGSVKAHALKNNVYKYGE